MTPLTTSPRLTAGPTRSNPVPIQTRSGRARSTRPGQQVTIYGCTALHEAVNKGHVWLEDRGCFSSLTNMASHHSMLQQPTDTSTCRGCWLRGAARGCSRSLPRTSTARLWRTPPRGADTWHWRACCGWLAWPKPGRTCGGRRGLACRRRRRRWQRRGRTPPWPSCWRRRRSREGRRARPVAAVVEGQ